MENKTCCCGSNNKMVIACSGAADLGYISDQVARRLSLKGQRKMSCMSLFASCTDEKIEEFKTKNLLVIDGCNEDCGKKIMANRGIDNFNHIRLTDLGFEKGNTPANQENIGIIFDKLEMIY